MPSLPRSLLALALLTASACAPLLGARPLRDATPGETTFHTLRVHGESRSYLLHLPPAAASGRPLPLVVAFHGFTGNANVMEESTGLDAAADARGVVVAYPNGAGRLRYFLLGWNAVSCCGSARRRHAHDVAFAVALVRELAARGLVDSSRVYAAGFSNGGMFALRLACERADVFRAVADVAGAMPDTSCTPTRPVAIALVRGTADPELPADHRMHLLRRGHRPFSISFENAFAFWAEHDRCAKRAVADTLAAASLERAVGCAVGGAVELYTVRDNPHAWPGGHPTWFFAPHPVDDFDASGRLLDFFAATSNSLAAHRGGGR